MQTATLSFVTDVAFATDMWEGGGWEAEVLCTMLLCLQVSLLAAPPPPMYGFLDTCGRYIVNTTVTCHCYKLHAL